MPTKSSVGFSDFLQCRTHSYKAILEATQVETIPHFELDKFSVNTFFQKRLNPNIIWKYCFYENIYPLKIRENLQHHEAHHKIAFSYCMIIMIGWASERGNETEEFFSKENSKLKIFNSQLIEVSDKY